MDKVSNNIYIGFDFSMNKPAATIYYNHKLYFFFWALKLSKKKIEKYMENGVTAMSRELNSIDTKNIENTQLVLIHTIRSTDLSNIIIKDLDYLINDVLKLEDYNLYICSEGLSYASKGDATLNLATYKGVLLSKLYEHYDNLKRLFTYSPNTLKSTAGCATKEKRGDKMNMIRAFMNENINHPFHEGLKNNILVSKTKFFEGVDDLVDSYWAFKTMIKKEKYPL
jgi:hypothetical protein